MLASLAVVVAGSAATAVDEAVLQGAPAHGGVAATAQPPAAGFAAAP